MALYPPVVASSMPAFSVKDKQVNIYFSYSSYNSTKSDIEYIQYSVRNLNSNVSVLADNEEIKSLSINDIKQDEIDKILNRYYITINDSDIKNGFKANQLYKVQLRFSTIKSTNYFTEANSGQFSEWSTVCVIKPINAPAFYLDEFETEGEKGINVISSTNNFNSILSDFIGIYKSNGSETLKSYRMRLLDDLYTQENYLNIKQYTKADSGVITSITNNYINDENSLVLFCSLPYQMTSGETYKILFEIQTKNGYTSSKLYEFQYTPTLINGIEEGKITTYTNEEQGYIKVNATSSETNWRKSVVLRRSDSDSDFLKWEDLKFYTCTGQVNFTYYDFTVESGKMYRYLVQKVDTRGRRGTPVYDQTRGASSLVTNEKGAGNLAEWNHSFLLESTGNGSILGTKQLKLKFDFQISNYKTNISESKTDTIGSKYPFIRRNGNMGYRSFSCSGTISQFMDDVDLFTNKEQLFNGYYKKYTEYKGQIQNYVNKYDYTYERKFREKVEEFLYNSKPKLYKSTQEGNILIKLMEVSLTPKNELGRLIYTFSATAYEIGQPTIANLNSYNLINIGTYLTTASISKTNVLGQLSSFNSSTDGFTNYFTADQNIFGTSSSGSTAAAALSIANKYSYKQNIDGLILTNFTVKWLRLTIESQPYLIRQNNGEYLIIDSSNQPVVGGDGKKLPLYQIQQEDNLYLGTLFFINNKPVIISNPNNIYQLQIPLGANTTIVPAKNTLMTVDFLIDLYYEQDASQVAKIIQVEQVNGQLEGSYTGEEQLISLLKYKYSFTQYNSTDNKLVFKKNLNGVTSILVDTQPGTEVYIKTSKSSTEAKFIVNETGELRIDPHDVTCFITYLKIKNENIAAVDTLVFYEAVIGRSYY